MYRRSASAEKQYLKTTQVVIEDQHQKTKTKLAGWGMNDEVVNE
jgi:hypothetical protein